MRFFLGKADLIVVRGTTLDVCMYVCVCVCVCVCLAFVCFPDLLHSTNATSPVLQHSIFLANEDPCELLIVK